MMAKQLVRLALILILVSVSCSFPVFSSTTPTPGAEEPVAQGFVIADPNSTATPTPFQPNGPTATLEVTPTPDATSELGTNLPDAGAPVRVNLPLPEGQIELLLLGSDWRPSSGYRTDVIMLVSINTKKGSVSVVSFPRDLYVTIPGWTTQRINTAQAHGGFEMMADTFEYNFGVRPKYYIMTNFQGFIGIIDSLGGITVEAGSSLSDTCDLPQASRGYCSVQAGSNHMNGETALWYVRSRHTSSDLDRLRRAQEVLYGTFIKLMSLDAVTRLPELYSQYQRSVETNLGLTDMLPMLPVASKVISDTSLVRRYAVAQGEVTPYVTDTGAQVLLPNFEAISAMIMEAVFNP